MRHVQERHNGAVADRFPVRRTIGSGAIRPTDWHAAVYDASTRSGMRRFALVRLEDDSGVSGTGVVAEGVESSDGRVVLFWLRSAATPEQPGCLGVYTTLAEMLAIHGHGGRTRVAWVD